MPTPNIALHYTVHVCLRHDYNLRQICKTYTCNILTYASYALVNDIVA